MELSVSFPHESTTTNRSLKIFNSIGQGKFSVFHAYCPSLKMNYALKAFPKNSIGEAHYKKEAILASLSHNNVIKHTAINIEDSENLPFYAMLTEFSKYENFLELVIGGVINSEILVRTYFHQLIAGLEYMHSQGVAHLDLKLDNLMLGSDFNLKIIDFDQAQKTTDHELTSAGTEGFRAPEVINGSCRNFCAADIYSAGVALYALATQEYPFREIKNDKKISLEHYSTFIRNNQAFWELKAAQKKDDAIFSQSFKELVNGMLEYQSEKRFTLEDIKKSNWFNGPVIEGETLKKEMKKRWESYFSAKRSEFCD